MNVKRVKLSNLTTDTRNANRGTQRGSKALEESLRRYGAGRSILVDKDGRIIAGNKTAEEASQIGLEDVIVVETDGKQLVAVKRTDISLDSPEGRGLAIADNRVSELNLDWDEDVLSALNGEGVDLAWLWNEQELSALLKDNAAAPTPEKYTRKIDIPLYEPRGEKPSPAQLTDLTRYKELVVAIEATPDLTDDEREFLKLAAARHIVFNYTAIADFYAHSSPEVQRLMEDSALVIVDFDRAIELGYVKLTKLITELFDEEYPDD